MKKRAEKWWRNSCTKVMPVQVDVQKVVGKTILWLDGKAVRRDPIFGGYASFHKTRKEAIDYSRTRLERSIKQLEACGDDPWRYAGELKELNENE